MKRTNLLLTMLIVLSISLAPQLLADRSQQADADFPQRLTIRSVHNATDANFQLTVVNEASACCDRSARSCGASDMLSTMSIVRRRFVLFIVPFLI